MRKTRVLLFLFMLLGTGLFAQSGNETLTLVGKEALLQQNAQLKEQANNVNSAYAKLVAAASGSRSSSAAAITELNDACNVYLAELKKQQSSSADVKFNEAISREIAAVKKVQADYCPTGK